MNTHTLTRAEKYTQRVKEQDTANREATEAAARETCRLIIGGVHEWMDRELGNTRTFTHSMTIPDDLGGFHTVRVRANMSRVCSLVQENLGNEGFECFVDYALDNSTLRITMTFNV